MYPLSRRLASRGEGRRGLRLIPEFGLGAAAVASPCLRPLIREHHEGFASDEIQSQLAAGHVRARELLLEHRDRVIRIAERLLDVRQIDEEEFLGLMSA